VTFNGNGHTSRERAEDFALLRAADLALDNGFTHFIVVDDEQSTSVDVIETDGESTTTGTADVQGGKIHYREQTSYTPGSTVLVRKPKVTIYVKCFAQQPDRRGALDARFLSESLRTTYGIKPRPTESERDTTK